MREPAFISDQLQKLKSNSHLRTLKTSQEIDFHSNDFFGLAQNEEIKDDYQKLVNELSSFGATGSRLISGNLDVHKQLESYCQDFFRSDACLIFSSGYQANIGLLSALPQRHDTIIYDELSHASIKDGIKLSNATSWSFKHNDVQDLELKISRAEGNTFVVIEALYSMDGDYGLVSEICDVCKQQGAFLIVDEAHTTGVNGPNGSGYCSELGLEKEVFTRIHTFGKAVGSQGAVIAGSQNLKDFLINRSRAFIYTTGISPLLAAHNIACLKHIKENHSVLKESLDSKKKLFSNMMGFDSSSAIVPVIMGSVEKAKEAESSLKKEDFAVKAILSPTVRKGTERLRICLHNFNSDEDIKKLATIVKSCQE